MHYLPQLNSSVKQNWFPRWLPFCTFSIVPQFPANAEIYFSKGHLHNISFYLDKVERLLPKAVRMQSSLGAQLRNRGVNLSAYLAFQRAYCVQSRILFQQTSARAVVAPEIRTGYAAKQNHTKRGHWGKRYLKWFAQYRVACVWPGLNGQVCTQLPAS